MSRCMNSSKSPKHHRFCSTESVFCSISDIRGSFESYDVCKVMCEVTGLWTANRFHGEWADFCIFSDNRILLVCFKVIMFQHYIQSIWEVSRPLLALLWAEVPHITPPSLPSLPQLCSLLAWNNNYLPPPASLTNISDGQKPTEMSRKALIYQIFHQSEISPIYLSQDVLCLFFTTLQGPKAV
jgi:hypothetical protein